MYALDTLTIHGILKLEHVGFVVHASDALHIFHTKESNNKNNTINKRNNKFIKELSSICSYEDNYLLIGHTGISYCHIGTDTIGDAKFEFLDMSFNSAAIAEGEDGKLILGSTTGLYIYDHGTHKMEHVVIPQDKLLRNTLYFFTQNMTMPVWVLLISGFIALIVFAGYYFRIFKPQKAKNKGNFQSGNKEPVSSQQNTVPQNSVKRLPQADDKPQSDNFLAPVKSPMDIAADEIKQIMNELAGIPEAKDEKKDEVDEKIKELANMCNMFMDKFEEELTGLNMVQNQIRPMATVWIYAYAGGTGSAKLGEIFKKYKKHRLPNSAYEISKLWDRICENISKIPMKERTPCMNKIHENIKLLQSENKKSR
jgi:hypothetical protein